MSHRVGSTVALLGPPASGKGTQAARLAACTRSLCLSTRTLCHEDERIELGDALAIEAFVERAVLGEDTRMVSVVSGHLRSLDAAANVVLVGFPRNLRQAQFLDGLLCSTARAPVQIVALNIDEEEMMRRALASGRCRDCGALNADAGGEGCYRCSGELTARADDAGEVVRARYRLFQRDTQAMLKAYRSRYSCADIEGRQSPDAVEAAIASALCELR
jgi:adenylate kinase